MRVLYLVRYADALSESYIRAEAEYAVSRGVEVRFCAQARAVDSYPVNPYIVRYDGDLEAAVREFKPDVIHVHWLTLAAEYADPLSKAGLPVTVRGHSFDAFPGNVKHVAAMGCVRKIWLFPHFAKHHQDLKCVEPLPVAYNAGFFSPGAEPRERRRVVRAGAGLPGKGLMDFLQVARLCEREGFEFLLALTEATGEMGHVDRMYKSPYFPKNVEIVKGLSHEQVAFMMQSAGIYLRHFQESSHPWGMPISIAEALASGMYVLAQDTYGAADYLGLAGATFTNPQHCASLIVETKKQDDSWWRLQTDAAAITADRYRPEHVLPQVIDYWRDLAGEKS
jgi:glycosyltransferase involved in cell wall biosynthesis